MPTGTFSGSGTATYSLTVNPTTITAAGTINAPATGVYGNRNTNWTLINFGGVYGGGDGVLLPDGPATVVNHDGGKIYGSSNGVYLATSPYFEIRPGTVTNYGTISGAYGVRLGKDGGLVVNGAGTATNAAILSTKTGIYMAGTGHIVGGVYSFSNTVVNYGTIRNTGTGDGVQIVASGGLVTNHGLLSSGGDAVFVEGLSESVVNYGTVTTSSTGGNAAVDLASGTVDNRRGGLISAPNTAVSIKGFFGYVLNDGAIKSTNGTGVYFPESGSVTNTSGGVITGGTAGIDLEGVAIAIPIAVFIAPTPNVFALNTVVNLGTIQGTGTAGGGGVGVVLSAGTIVNGGSDAGGAVIYGIHAGIDIKGTYPGDNPQGGLGNVVNYGTIYAPSGTGVYLRDGGTVANYGSIEGHGFAAMKLFAGVSISGSTGNVVNGVGGRIAGGYGVRADVSTSATITNLGEIQGLGEFGLGVSITAGTITNGATGITSASINGPNGGVRFTSTASGSGLVNFGSITSGTFYGLVGPTGPPSNYDDGISFAGIGSVGNYGTIVSKAFSSAAIYQRAGGTVVNGSGGVTSALISGYRDGVGFASTASGGTVVNYGTIRGTGTLKANYLNAGSGAGVDLGIGGIVTNRGTISDASTNASAIYLGNGGSINNTGFISAYHLGVFAGTLTDPGTVDNLGTIQSTQTGTAAGFAGDGILLQSGGTVTNGDPSHRDAMISAIDGSAISIDGAAGTVINYGTISATVGDTAVAFGVGNDLLLDHPSAVFGGGVDGGGGANTLELAAGTTTGTLSGFGTSFTNFGTVAVDAAATWLLTETTTLGAGTTVTNAGTLQDGGSLASDGVIDIEAAAHLDLFGGGSGSGSIGFVGAGGILQLGSSGITPMLGNALTGFAAGDTIDLRALGFAASNTAVLSGNTLTVTGGGGTKVALTVTGLASGSAFSVANDGFGGSAVALSPPPPPPPPPPPAPPPPPPPPPPPSPPPSPPPAPPPPPPPPPPPSPPPAPPPPPPPPSPPPPPPSPPGGQIVFGPPTGFPAVALGINDGTPGIPAPVTGNYNIEVFTAAGVTTLPTLDSGFQTGAIDPGGALVAPGFLTGITLQLFSGDYLLTDTVFGSGRTATTIILGSGNQTVVGAPGDTLQGGSGSQVLNAIQQFSSGAETIIGGCGPTTVYGGPSDSALAGSGNTYVDGTAGKMAISVGSAGTDSIVGNVATNTISGVSAGPDTLTGGAAVVQVQGLGMGDIVSFANQTGNASINATIGNIAVTLGGGAASVFGGAGDTINLGLVGQYADGGAGKMTIGDGSTGVDSVFGSSIAAGDTILGGSAALDFNPQPGGGSDLINLAASSANATVNAFSAGGTQLTAVNDTIMAGTGTDSVWGGPADRIGVGTSSSAGGTHLFDHSTSIAGAALAFGTNDSVTGSSTAKVTVTNFNSGTDSLFYKNENLTTIASIVATSSSLGGDTTFAFPDGTAMTLIGVTSITAGLFKP